MGWLSFRNFMVILKKIQDTSIVVLHPTRFSGLWLFFRRKKKQIALAGFYGQKTGPIDTRYGVH